MCGRMASTSHALTSTIITMPKIRAMLVDLVFTKHITPEESVPAS
jgi:hypothetical protein